MSKARSAISSSLSWNELNDAVRGSDDEAALRAALEKEMCGRRRKVYALRLHSRLNRVRAAREREEIMKRIEG